MAARVHHLLERTCFELIESGARAHLDYRLLGDKMVIEHTFVPESMRGGGIAGILAKSAFSYAKGHELKVIPQCSYILSYAARHPEVSNLIV